MLPVLFFRFTLGTLELEKLDAEFIFKCDDLRSILPALLGVPLVLVLIVLLLCDEGYRLLVSSQS